jgi:hypothetical protein
MLSLWQAKWTLSIMWCEHTLRRTPSSGTTDVPFVQIQEGISVCDRSNGHLILDFNHSARYNVHDSNTLAYRQREGQHFSTRKDQHSGHTCVFQAIRLTKSMGRIYSLETPQALISQ